MAMPGSTNEIDDLIVKFLQGRLTEQEQDQLDEWINVSENNRALFEKLTNEKWVSGELETFYTYDEEAGWNRIRRAYPLQQTPVAMKNYGWGRWAFAASLLIALSAGIYYLVIKPRPLRKEVGEIERIHRDFPAPAKNIATITLSNGQKIYLDSVQDGQLVLQGSIRLVKLANGQIAYKAVEGTGMKETVYNTLENPKGSKVIDMLLADGSRVWLNAGSSITYPVVFVERERTVFINGEAYFEIAHDADKPFKVKKGDMEVTVLGTDFNVNAYDDEPDIRVTLLEGSVKVFNGKEKRMLEPGQQVQIEADMKVISDVDVETIMAWKNGLFSFNNTSLEEMMRQISRWYDVNVKYEGGIPERRFGGKIHRDANISEVLKILKESNVQYTINNRDIVIKS